MKLLRLVWHGLAVVGVVSLGSAWWFAAQGVSAKPTPGPLETRLARTARHLLIPAEARARTMPIEVTPDRLRFGMEHFADHCASCHANDGSGQTEMGQAFFPKAPDMRLPATQDLSDGELFHIIEEGVKLTGMPGWGNGTPESAESTWHLVQFIRYLPTLSEEEVAVMDDLNPRGREEWLALEEERRFLSGTLDVPTPRRPHGH